MIILPSTDDKRQLVAIYFAADIFFNPIWEDNYPTVSLVAEACGVPVATFPVGGCAETIGLNADSAAVANVDSAVGLFKAAVQRQPLVERRSYES